MSDFILNFATNAIKVCDEVAPYSSQ